MPQYRNEWAAHVKAKLDRTKASFAPEVAPIPEAVVSARGKKKRGYLESATQQKFIKWSRGESSIAKYPGIDMMYAIPNAGKMSPQAGARARSEGLTAGVPDTCLPVPRGGYGALYIEFKHGKNRLNEAQAEYQPKLSIYNCVVVCYSLEAAVAAVVEYYSLPAEKPVVLP
jgi:hypothetical protein